MSTALCLSIYLKIFYIFAYLEIEIHLCVKWFQQIFLGKVFFANKFLFSEEGVDFFCCKFFYTNKIFLFLQNIKFRFHKRFFITHHKWMFVYNNILFFKPIYWSSKSTYNLESYSNFFSSQDWRVIFVIAILERLITTTTITLFQRHVSMYQHFFLIVCYNYILHYYILSFSLCRKFTHP